MKGGAALPPANPVLTFHPSIKHFSILAIPGLARSVVMYMFRLAGHYRSSGMARRRGVRRLGVFASGEASLELAYIEKTTSHER